jgi:hypothetical protein
MMKCASRNRNIFVPSCLRANQKILTYQNKLLPAIKADTAFLHF